MSSYKHFDPKVSKKRTKYRAKAGTTQHEVYVLKTNKHIVAVLYDTIAKRDVTSLSTRPKTYKACETRMQDAFKIGQLVAEACKSKSISQVYFNKLNYKFHGIVKEVTRGIKESGINI